MSDLTNTSRIDNKPPPAPSHICNTCNSIVKNVNNKSSTKRSFRLPRLGRVGPITFRRRANAQPEPEPDSHDPLPNGKRSKKQSCPCPSPTRLLVELESDIFLRLPAEDLHNCKYVCKRWRDLINSPYIMTSHISRVFSNVLVKNTSFSIMFFNSKRNRDLFSIEFGSRDHNIITPTYYHLPLKKSQPRLVGSCNGLLCFDCYPSNTQRRCFSLYNPATGAFKFIPRLTHPQNGSSRVQSGFGYDSVNDDYKILCINGFQSFIYSLRNNSWKYVTEPAYYPDNVDIRSLTTSSPMVLANNSLYFTILWNNYNDVPLMTKMIIGFDLASEFFYQVSLPLDDEQEFRETRSDWYLAPITGRCLHLVSVQGYKSEIWIMKEDGVWTRMICFSRETEKALCDLIDCDRTCVMPYAYSEDGREMLIGIGLKYWMFIRFNLCTHQQFKKYQISGVPIDWAWFYKSMPWVGSLISPSCDRVIDTAS